MPDIQNRKRASDDLRVALIKLAQDKPELRAHLIPLLRGAAGEKVAANITDKIRGSILGAVGKAMSPWYDGTRIFYLGGELTLYGSHRAGISAEETRRELERAGMAVTEVKDTNPETVNFTVKVDLGRG